MENDDDPTLLGRTTASLDIEWIEDNHPIAIGTEDLIAMGQYGLKRRRRDAKDGVMVR